MSNDSYYIPLLFKAMESVDVGESLRQAFRTIVDLGQEEPFRKGYEQFAVFMDAVVAAYMRDVDEAEVTDIDGGNEIAVLPELAETWGSVKHDLGLEPDAEVHVVFLLQRNEESPQRLRLSREERKSFFRGMLPGVYGLSLASGRVIWEAELTKQDLLSAYAFAGEPLRLAADTDGAQEKPTRRAVLLDGEVTVCVFAGPAHGRIEIEWCIR